MIHSILYVDRCDAVLGKVKVHMLNDVLFASQRLIPVLELNFFALQLLSWSIRTSIKFFTCWADQTPGSAEGDL